jgi:hypothetical protein
MVTGFVVVELGVIIKFFAGEFVVVFIVTRCFIQAGCSVGVIVEEFDYFTVFVRVDG